MKCNNSTLIKHSKILNNYLMIDGGTALVRLIHKFHELQSFLFLQLNKQLNQIKLMNLNNKGV